MTTLPHQVLHFPVERCRPPQGRTMRHVTLLHLDGRVWTTAGFLPGAPGAAWAWIQEVVAAEYECAEEDVHVLESEACDLITADGIPVCSVAL